MDKKCQVDNFNWGWSDCFLCDYRFDCSYFENISDYYFDIHD